MTEQNPSDNAFDDISRILASTTSRRQAIKMIAATVAGLAVEHILPKRVFGGPILKPKKPSVLDLPVANLLVQQQNAYSIILLLRQQYHAPISFVQDANDVPLSLHVMNGTIKDVLAHIVKQNPAYRWLLVDEKVVLFSNDRGLQSVVKGVDITNVPRYNACFQYIRYLRHYSPEYQNFGTGLGGSVRAEIFTTPVTLTSQDTVLSQLVQLTGTDSTVCFDMVQVSDGILQFGLDRVKEQTSPNPANPTAQGSSNHAQAVGGQTDKTTGMGTMVNPMVAATPLASGSSCRAINFSSSEDGQGTHSVTSPCSDAEACGGHVVINYTNISVCPGDDCSGQVFHEVVPHSGSCNITPHTSDGVIASDSNPNIDDDYSACVDPPRPNGCQQILTQTIMINGNTVKTCTMTFTIPPANGNNCGSATQFIRTCGSPAHTSADCCGVNPPGSASDPKKFCDPSSQVCVSDNGIPSAMCCKTGTPLACNHVCCPPGYGCVQDAVTLLNVCCASGTTLACNGACCTSGQTCTAQTCCPQGQATSDNKKCCSAGQTVCGTNCCQSGQTCTGGVCCPQGQATSDNKTCCQQGYVPCGTACCAPGSVCCGTGSNAACCAGTCDNTGNCITNGENM